MNAATRIAVIICSVGRPDSLRGLVPALARQSRPADRVLFVVTKPEDIGFDPQPLFPEGTPAETLIAPKGLPKQRNFGLDALGPGYDVVVFFDDDFIPSRHALAGIEAAFAAHPEVNGVTGHVIADGINAPGFSQEEADRMVDAWDETHGPIAPGTPVRILRRGLDGLYGCNMAYRMSAVGATRFDEKLPLYGWQEDSDFSARIPGDRIKTDALAGVHRGTKGGRETAGRRLGYSQVANNYYLWRKGTMSARFAGKLVIRNLIANHVKILRPEPWIDRAARASGNRLALMDVLRGRADPERILSL